MHLFFNIAARSCAALAAGLAAAAAMAAGTPAPATSPDKPSSPPSAFGTPVDADRLTGKRGGASSVSTQVDIGGTLKNNTANQVVTGNNAIRDGSFAHSAGFNTVIQNSGANVLIQNSMTVNVQFK